MQNELIKHLLKVIESPFAIKNYKDLEEFYLKNGMTHEANAFKHLIETKSDNGNHISN
jgi:hypothetical protein